MTNLNEYQTLQSLCNDLGEVEDQLSELQAERDQLRAQISEVVERMGGKATLHGFGSLQISAPTVVTSYDRRGIEVVVQQLRESGYTDIADAIDQHRKQSMRSGGLRVTREKSE